MAEDLESNKDYGKTHFSWSFSEFNQYERSKDWYIKVGLVVFGLLMYALLDPQISLFAPYLRFTGPNYLFGFLIILFSLLILMYHRNTDTVEFKITEDGVLVNDKLHQYKDIKNFYIIYDPPTVKTLYFEPKSFFNPRIPINLTDQNPVAIRELLKQYLEENVDRENEPVSEQVSRLFKF